MPQVPTYGGAQVQRAPLQTPMQSTPDVSSGLQAAGRALGQVAEVLDQKIVRDAEAEANSVDSKITADWLNWDAENRNKYQGQNADEYAAKAKEWWDKAGSDLKAGVSPLAARRLSDVLPRKQNQAMASVLGHVSTLKERYADESAEAAAQTAIEFGIDTGSVAAARNEVRTITAQQGARKGWDTAMVQAEQQRRLGTLHLSYITRLADSDPEKARAYYDQNKAEIPGVAQAKVETLLKNTSDDQFALKFAATNAGAPLDQQLRDAGEIADPQRREKTIQQIKLNQGLMKAAQQEREQAAADQAWQLVGQGKRVPEQVLGTMDGRQRVQLQDYLRQRAEHMAAQGRKPVTTDPITHAALWEMATRDPAKFKEERLFAYGMKLAQSDIEQLYKMQQGMLNPKSEKDVISWNNKVTSRLEMLKINTGNGAQEEQRGQFRAAAQREFEKFQATNGKAPNQQQEDEILDRLMLPGKSGWFDSGETRNYAESLATGKKFEPDISSGDRDLIVKALKAEGTANPTSDQITARFKLAKGIK